MTNEETMESFGETVQCHQFNTIITGRLYFVSCSADVVSRLRAHKDVSVFSIDNELVYENFFNDFGPLNISMVYRYCTKLKKKLSTVARFQRKIIHACDMDEQKRVNAAFLMGAFQIIYLQRSSKEALEHLLAKTDYVSFRDAAIGHNAFPLELNSCLSVIEKAVALKWLDFGTFSCEEYEHYERVENGDLNWILPAKILAFCGPHNVCRVDNGYPVHSPESYFDYFRKNNVTDIVRLNKRIYDSNRFVSNGFKHHDLYFLDGGVPTEEIMLRFIEICENAQGAVAVHCKAGLGRTGTLIGCYIMKHFQLNAQETIAWLRICRPGSVIGSQQLWLHDREQFLQSLLRISNDNVHNHNHNHNNNNNTNTTNTTTTNNNNTNKKLTELDDNNIGGNNNIENNKKKKQIINTPNNGGGLNVTTINKNRKIEDDISKCVADIKLDSSQILETQGEQLNQIKARRKLNLKVEKL